MVYYELDKKNKKAVDTIESIYCNDFNKIYSCANENIKEYINMFDLDGKSLLTVGSSADQAINAVLNDCRDITIIDLCPFTKHYFNLKKAALLTLNYYQFQKFFYDYDGAHTNFDLFDKKVYSMLRDCLGKIDCLSLRFWDALYYKYNPKIIRYRLFKADAVETSSIKQYNPYLMSDFNYSKLRLRMKNINPKFINGNVLDMDYYLKNEKYDNIFLSNVYDYLKKDNYNLMQFKILVSALDSRLKKDGTALISYLYGTNTNANLIDFKKQKIRNDLEYRDFLGVRGLYCDANIKDTAVILKKTKK